MTPASLLALLVAAVVVGGVGGVLARALAPTRLAVAERVAMSLALGFAVLGTGALALDASPWGLHAWSWLGLLAVVALLAWRARPRGGRVPRPRRRRRFAVAPAAVAAVVVAGGALALASTPLPQQRAAGYELLWAVPRPGGMAVGVESRHPGSTTFRVQVMWRGRVVFDRSGLTLATGQRWTTALHAPVGTPIHVRLFREGVPWHVREVHGRVRP